MARIEILTLDGVATEVAKQPAEYFAEWRAEVERGRRRRQELGLDPFLPDRQWAEAHGRTRRPADRRRSDQASIPA